MLASPVAPERGSIPACAGEPPTATRATCCWRVYPRVCGGTAARRRLPLPRQGLSPRVRGNRNRRAPERAAPRSIPACAGEPPSACHTIEMPPVYPRVCGGTHGLVPPPQLAGGLSPRVRGNLLPTTRGTGLQPSIPACAGEPRVGAGFRPPDRSIPACAGEPSPYWKRTVAARVYPRVCGGTDEVGRNVSNLDGLSPRVRGNPEQADGEVLAARSIPACAGEPFRSVR